MDSPQNMGKLIRKKGEEMLQAPELGFPCSLWRAMREQVSHCSLWMCPEEAAAGGCVTKQAAASGAPTPEQRLGRNCGLWRGVHTGAGFVDLWPVGAPQ